MKLILPVSLFGACFAGLSFLTERFSVFTQLFRWLNLGIGFGALISLVLIVVPPIRNRFVAAIERINSRLVTKEFAMAAFVGCAAWVSFMAVFRFNLLQSASFDLGYTANVAWNFLHGNGFLNSFEGVSNYLGEHWQPVFALFAPLLLIWEDPRILLILQGTALAGTAFLYARLIYKSTNSHAWALAGLALFLFNPFFHRINKSTFHAEAVAMPLLLLGFHGVMGGNFWKGAAWLAAATFFKEDIPLYSFAAGAVLLFNRERRWKGLLLAVVSAGFFYYLTGHLMLKLLDKHVSFFAYRYSHLGSTTPEMISNLVTNFPKITLSLATDLRIVKTIIQMLLGFCFLPLLGGLYALAALIMYVPHMLSLIHVQAILQAHYSVGLFPMVALAALQGIIVLERRRITHPTLIEVRRCLPGLSVLIAIVLFAFAVTPYTSPVPNGRLIELKPVVEKIPSEASVSVHSNLGPLVCLRKTFRPLADYQNTDYVLFDSQVPDSDVTSEKEYFDLLETVRASEQFEVVADQSGFVLFRKK